MVSLRWSASNIYRVLSRTLALPYRPIHVYAYFDSCLLAFASEECVWKHTSIQICDRKVDIYMIARVVSLSLRTRYISSMGRAIPFAVAVLWVIDVAYMLRLL